MVTMACPYPPQWHQGLKKKETLCSYGHLLVITCYNWLFQRDYTFYKWGFLSTYN